MFGILLSILFFILPTIFFYLLLQRLHFIKSTLFKICLSWFVGQYTATLVIFFIALFLSSFVSNVLLKATCIYMDLLLIGFIFLAKDLKKLFILFRQIKLTFNYPKVIFLLLCFGLSSILFLSQLRAVDKVIYISPVYWDFNIHFPVIQNFVFGDNFPPQNESFANTPMIYHYFYDLLTAIYASIGLDLVNAMNVLSITTCFFMLASIIGFCEEMFKTSLIGYISVILTVTSSSLHFIFYFIKMSYMNLLQILKNIFINTQNPFLFSLDPQHFGYNGTMFNMFYYIAERHLMFATIFILLSMVIINYKHYLSNRLCLILGILFGLFFTWHLAATIMIGSCLFFVYIFGKDKKKTILILLGYAIPFCFYTLFFKVIEMNPAWFYQEVKGFPRVNFNFPTSGTIYSFSIMNALLYYLNAYGIKLFLFPIGLIFLYKRNKNQFFLFSSLIIPIFILLNTFQVFPLSVYDNHKFIRPITVIADTIVAYFLVKVLLEHKEKKDLILGIFIFSIYLFLLSFSGILEIIPFINTKPTIAYAAYPSVFINDIRTKTPPKSVFVSPFSKELHLAGRKIFLGTSDDEPGATSVNDAGYVNENIRKNLQEKLYNSPTKEQFCKLAKINHIDYVLFNEEQQTQSFIKKLSYFDTIDEYNIRFGIVNIKKSCM